LYGYVDCCLLAVGYCDGGCCYLLGRCAPLVDVLLFVFIICCVLPLNVVYCCYGLLTIVQTLFVVCYLVCDRVMPIDGPCHSLFPDSHVVRCVDALYYIVIPIGYFAVVYFTFITIASLPLFGV